MEVIHLALRWAMSTINDIIIMIIDFAKNGFAIAAPISDDDGDDDEDAIFC